MQHQTSDYLLQLQCIYSVQYVHPLSTYVSSGVYSLQLDIGGLGVGHMTAGPSNSHTHVLFQ